MRWLGRLERGVPSAGAAGMPPLQPAGCRRSGAVAISVSEMRTLDLKHPTLRAILSISNS